MSGVEILDNGTRVLTTPRAAFGTDALLLGRFAQPRRAERALDMCSGCGVISLLWHDLRMFCAAGPEQGKYDFAACNPPYFTAGPQSPDPVRAAARHTVTCTTEDVAQCARRALRDGGRFVLCQRPDQLVEVLCALRAARLEPKRLAFVRQRTGSTPWLFLVEAQKGRKPGLKLEPDILIESGVARYGK